MENYMIALVEVTVPRIIKGTRGRINLRISDLNGQDVDLSVFDKITLVLKNWPERDESINRDCYISSADSSVCYFDFTEEESEDWLSAPYFAQFQFVTFSRDQSLVVSATGYTPSISTMNIKACTFDFEVHEVVTGALSGATASVYGYESFGGGLGQLKLYDVSGDFLDEEAVTGSVGGVAEVVVGVTETEWLLDRFADDSTDFDSEGVRVGDELEVDSIQYAVSGRDPIVEDWLTIEEEMETAVSAENYEILTYDETDSEKTALSKTLEFALYVEESLS